MLEESNADFFLFMSFFIYLWISQARCRTHDTHACKLRLAGHEGRQTHRCKGFEKTTIPEINVGRCEADCTWGSPGIYSPPPSFCREKFPRLIIRCCAIPPPPRCACAVPPWTIQTTYLDDVGWGGAATSPRLVRRR